MAMARMAEMKGAIRVFFASGPPSRFDRLSFVGAGLRSAPRFAPLAVVLIPPEHFFRRH